MTEPALLQLPRIEREFFLKDTIEAAKGLLGKILIKKTDKGAIAARIVETEAYLGADDPACHAARGKTKRNAPMFEEGGILYVYKIYGIHFCANIVTEAAGIGSAVLIRAGEPIAGIKIMEGHRGTNNIKNLLKGPGNFAKAFNYTKEDNYLKVGEDGLIIADEGESEHEIIRGGRIGIKKGCELHYRFFVSDSEYVSGKKRI